MALPPVGKEDLDLVLGQTAESWELMRGQRLFLTGGTGFFGCWLVESFCHANRSLDLGAQVTLLSRDPEGFARKCPHLASDNGVTLLMGDVRSFEFPSGAFRYVIHAATDTRAQATAEAARGMLSTIVEGTRRTLEFAATHETKAFLLTSSGAVYGRQPADVSHVAETFAPSMENLEPANDYARGKLLAEQLCEEYAAKAGMGCKIARCWAFCGPHLPLNEHFAIGNFIGDVLAGRGIEVRGDGTALRSYLYAADLAIWLWTMLFRGPDLAPINVGSANDLSILELAQRVGGVLGSEAGIRVAERPTPGAPPARYVPCVDRAAEVLGLRETVPLEEGIRRTALWYGWTPPEKSFHRSLGIKS